MHFQVLKQFHQCTSGFWIDFINALYGFELFELLSSMHFWILNPVHQCTLGLWTRFINALWGSELSSSMRLRCFELQISSHQCTLRRRVRWSMYSGAPGTLMNCSTAFWGFAMWGCFAKCAQACSMILTSIPFSSIDEILETQSLHQWILGLRVHWTS